MFDRTLTLGNKIKPTGGGAPRSHNTQIGANGSSQNDSNKLPVKFQVNRTSNDRTSKLDIFRTVKSSLASTGPQTASKLNGRSYQLLRKLHLKFQVIPTSFDLVSTLGEKSSTKSSAFPKIGNFVPLFARLLDRFSSVESSQ